MINFIAERDCWIIVSTPSVPNLCRVDEGQHFTSNQQITEVFYDKDLAIKRIKQLDYSWEEPELQLDTFTTDNLVIETLETSPIMREL